jgi:hypothetical protein
MRKQEEDGRKRGVPGISVTGPALSCGSASRREGTVGRDRDLAWFEIHRIGG